jgi:large subunit ribosomal protein L6
MSRVANRPVILPKGVEFSLAGSTVTLKGSKGTLTMDLNSEVQVEQDDEGVKVSKRSNSRFAAAIAGTTRALLNNMVTGVSDGFERKLQLVGVGYRAQAQGGKLNLTLGFSHPVVYEAPDGVTIETPSQTEVVLKGVDKQRVGQAAAEIRRFRPPEPYKGKGVRYADERVVLKEAKKK